MKKIANMVAFWHIICYQTKGKIHSHVINFCMLFIGLRQQQKLKKELETHLLCGVFSARFFSRPLQENVIKRKLMITLRMSKYFLSSLQWLNNVN